MSRHEAPVKVHFVKRASEELDELLMFIGSFPWGNAPARHHDIRHALDRLRIAPELGRVFKRTSNRVYRVLIVRKRFLVPYVYYPPVRNRSYSLISVRAVRHAAQQRPLQGVREEPRIALNFL